MKKDITIIIPLHKFDNEVSKLLGSAVASIDSELNDVVFVGPKDVLDEALKIYEKAETIINDDTDVYTQINTAALQCTTPYFTVLEFDDILLKNWSRVISKEIKDRNSSVILPINEYVEGNIFKSFGNEIAWDAAFIGETDDIKLGHLTEEELKIYKDFNVTGGVIKTEDFITIGCLKPEFKFAAWFEFLMRLVRNGKDIYITPRVCYRHTIFRKGSYMDTIKDSVSSEEATEILKSVLEK